MKKYQIIYADPPWQFKNYNDKKSKKWAGEHYSLMTTEYICNLPIKDIADDNCILFIWGTFPKLPDCLKVIEAWGFEYKTLGFNWYKENQDRSLFFGMGYWTRSNSEYCLLATKGKPKRIDASVFQVIRYPRLEHSKKPPIIRDKIVELVGDLPRIELFAREKTEGWDVFGNEVEGSIKLPTGLKDKNKKEIYFDDSIKYDNKVFKVIMFEGGATGKGEGEDYVAIESIQDECINLT